MDLPIEIKGVDCWVAVVYNSNNQPVIEAYSFISFEDLLAKLVSRMPQEGIKVVIELLRGNWKISNNQKEGKEQ